MKTAEEILDNCVSLVNEGHVMPERNWYSRRSVLECMEEYKATSLVMPCDKEVRETLHIILSKIDIDKDNLDYIKANEEICGKLRWDLVERISNYIKNIKDE